MQESGKRHPWRERGRDETSTHPGGIGRRVHENGLLWLNNKLILNNNNIWDWENGRPVRVI